MKSNIELVYKAVLVFLGDDRKVFPIEKVEPRPENMTNKFVQAERTPLTDFLTVLSFCRAAISRGWLNDESEIISILLALDQESYGGTAFHNQVSSVLPDQYSADLSEVAQQDFQDPKTKAWILWMHYEFHYDGPTIAGLEEKYGEEGAAFLLFKKSREDTLPVYCDAIVVAPKSWGANEALQGFALH